MHRIFLYLAEVSLPLTVALYFNQAVVSFFQGKYAFALVWTCYATANIGLIIASK